jgi:uncharacterized protein YifN (PemK superfamily)
VDVIVSIVRGRGFDPKYANGIFCKFDFYGNPGETTMVQGTSDPEFDFRQQVRQLLQISTHMNAHLSSR